MPTTQAPDAELDEPDLPDGDIPASATTKAAPSEKTHRAALIATAAVLLLVLIALPFALRSMAATLFGEQERILYDLDTDSVVPPVVTEPVGNDRNYVNIAVVALDPASGQATFAISGNRICTTDCTKVDLTLLALDDNAAQRRGLPPTATVTLDSDDHVFSESVVLPVRGRPNRYPFDAYELWLGIAVVVTWPDGTPLSQEEILQHDDTVVTLQSQLSYLEMAPPVSIDPSRASAATDPYAIALVRDLHFERPEYLKILAVLLVTLIAVSGSIALLRRDIDDLLLGIGGLILGVWGIRSVLNSQPLPGVTAIDLALSLVILIMLLGLTVRLTLHFHRGSNWRWRGRGRTNSA
ncbi:MAG: hypothetical protein KC442_07945 [Thermomicrobiales bacterium]|nr:hypothetical protein [Thermomicrobiales bacterium]